MSLDNKIDGFFAPVSDAIGQVIFYSIPLIEGVEVKLTLVWLVFAAVFLTFALGLINFRLFAHAFQILKDEFINRKSAPPPGDGQISRFKALATSLSGTVGLGNIAGVAVAISLGGPGAAFWMMVMGVLSMATKFSEVMLSVKYRIHNDPAHPQVISGGPMYYLKVAFDKYKMHTLGTVVAGIFALCCIGGAIGGGNMFQANQAYQQFVNVSGGAESYFADKGWLFGLGLSVLVGAVIIGGIRSIANVASKLVPAMGVLYMATSFVVIGMHIEHLGTGLITIFNSAFSLEAGLGGFLGAILVGVQRAAFSNEAGLGSAAIVHANARTDDPVSQGLVGMLGPFFDTIIICMTTALLIVITGVYDNADGIAGIQLTSDAMSEGFAFFPYILFLCVFLFAFSTLITWYYYGEKAFTFLVGPGDKREFSFKIFFLLCIILGSSAQLGSVMSLADALLLSMAIPNIIGIYLLLPEIRADVKKYSAELNK